MPRYPNQSTNPFGPGYSVGRYEPFVFNGVSMNESAGLGISPSTEAPILNVFNGGAMARGFVDNATGTIDWNMDGVIEAGTVRAPANWANNTCASPYFRAAWGLANSAGGVAFPTLAVADASTTAPQLYAATSFRGNFGIAGGQGNASLCANPGLDGCTTWKWSSLSVGAAPVSALAVAGGMIVFRTSSGHMTYFNHLKAAPLLGVDPVGTTRLAGQSGTTSGPTTTGDPAAIEVDGHVRVYIPSEGNLRRWEFDETSGTWVAQGADELWDDGTPIHTSLGISVVHGATRPGGEGIFAVIPNSDLAAPGEPMPIEFAQLQSTNQVQVITVPALNIGFFTIPSFTFSVTVRMDRWHRLTPAANTFGTVQVSRPGLAYVPFDLSSPDDGRFYATWVPGGNGFQSKTARIIFTQGNDTTAGATSRALVWMGNQQTTFADDNNQDRDLTRGVVLARFGQSVTGATSGSSNIFSASISYFPAADGIINADVHDYADDRLVRHNLACSVHGDECDDSP